jgi:hypothetical protein
MTNKSKTQMDAALNVVQAIAETIRELGELPSGELYARLVGKLDLPDYEEVIRILKETGLVTETPGHLLRWNEPETNAQ